MTQLQTALQQTASPYDPSAFPDRTVHIYFSRKAQKHILTAKLIVDRITPPS